MTHERTGGWGARRVAAEQRLGVRLEQVLAWIDQRPRTARLYHTIRGVIRQQSIYRLSLDAAGAAFWLVIALFPAVIAAITVFGLVADPVSLAADVEEITRRAPNSFGAVLATQAQQVAASDAGSLSVGLVASLTVTLWSVSSGGYALFRAIRESYDLPPQNYVVARARAFGAGVAAVLVLGVVVAATALIIDRSATASGRVMAVVAAGGGLAALTLFALGVLATFRFAIAAPAPLRSLLPGTVLATAATTILVLGVAAFGSWLSSYQAIYGALTSVIVTLLSFYVLMYVLLLCAVFNQQWEPLPQTTVGQLQLAD